MGRTIRVRGLDDRTIDRLRSEAAHRGMNLESYAADILRQSVGGRIVYLPSGPHPNIESFAGTWTDEDFREFSAVVAAFEQIDDALWK